MGSPKHYMPTERVVVLQPTVVLNRHQLSWGVEAFVRTPLSPEMDYACVRTNASTPYDIFMKATGLQHPYKHTDVPFLCLMCSR